MGGSGGGWLGDIDPIKQAQRVRESESKTQDAGFETTVNEYLSGELSRYNDRDAETIQKSLEIIKSDISDKIDGSVDILFGGSVSKNTYVDGLSDIDSLILINKSELSDKNPQELLKYFGKILTDRYGEEKVWVGQLAVTVQDKAHEIQLLPALKVKDDFKISSLDGKSWSKIQPQKFAEVLTKINQSQNGKVIPAIKLAKAIVSQLPDKQKLSGYHIESLAARLFRNYSDAKTPKKMLVHFFEKASQTVLNPMRDPTGQSTYVDEYLGSKNSVGRRVISMTLQRISRKMKNADGMKSLNHWKQIIGEN